MKVIDYSPIDENIFITADNDEGYIKIFENNILIYSSTENPDIYAQYICFSHDGRNALFIEHIGNIEKFLHNVNGMLFNIKDYFIESFFTVCLNENFTIPLPLCRYLTGKLVQINGPPR